MAVVTRIERSVMAVVFLFLATYNTIGQSLVHADWWGNLAAGRRRKGG